MVKRLRDYSFKTRAVSGGANRPVFALLWHALVIGGLIVSLSEAVVLAPVWSAPRTAQEELAAVAVGYAATATLVALLRFWNISALLSLVPSTVAIFGSLAILLVLTNRSFPQATLIAGLVVTLMFSALPFAIHRARAFALAVLAIAVTGSWAFSADMSGRRGSIETRVIASATVDLDVVRHHNLLPKSVARGGAVVALGDGFLIVDGDGRFTRLVGRPTEVRATPMALRAPLNAAEFDGDAPPEADRRFFRVADLVVQPVEDRLRAFVSHHFWYRERRCWVVRVSEATLNPGALDTETPSWRTVYESQPCLALKAGVKSLPFTGLHIGGALALVDQSHLLLALGDHQFDGVLSSPAVSQDPGSDYGKSIAINLAVGGAESFTIGHRNPEGLAVDATGGIWLTEQGPEGGDELNRIQRGADYGWPSVTFGAVYGGAAWPLNRNPGEHDGFTLPVFSWVPSVAPTDLIVVGSDTIPGWKGDLLIASLQAKALLRLRVRENRVVYTEPIAIGLRIRDLAEGTAGLLLMTDEGPVVTVAPATGLALGARAFTRCAPCHAIGDGLNHGIGPDLSGIYLRRVGGAPGFEYSPALQKLGGLWNERRLEAYLLKPEGFVPGTTMQFEGLSGREEVEALIGYLKRH